MLAPSAVDHGFKSQSGQTKDYKIGIYYKQEKHADFSPMYRPVFKGNLPVS